MKENKDKLSLWQICNDCGARCCTEKGAPIVFPEEVDIIREFLEKNKLPDHIKPIPGSENFSIPRAELGCPYLQEGKCSIQEVKPLDCRVYPIGLSKSMRGGIDEGCPAKHLLSNQYKNLAQQALDQLSPERKKAFLQQSNNAGYAYSEKVGEYGMELLLDLYGCDPKIIASREHLIRYNKEIVPLIGMKAVGEPLIPEKFGEGTLYGYSSIQFIQTSSIVVHVSEPMLEVHTDIFTCKSFDPTRATQFTKEFFKARKVRSKFVSR